jgi:hypothetical protein
MKSTGATVKFVAANGDAPGHQLRALEGHHVSVTLKDGSRFDDVQLISSGRCRTRTLWLYSKGLDSFVAVDDVVRVWEVA